SWARIGRLDHLPQFAVPRRESVVNGFFQGQGLNEVELKHREQDGFDANMWTIVHSDACPLPYTRETLQSAIAHFPRNLIDYVGLNGVAPLPPTDSPGMR